MIREERLRGDDLIRFLRKQFTLLVAHEGDSEARRIWLAAMAEPVREEANK